MLHVSLIVNLMTLKYLVSGMYFESPHYLHYFVIRSEYHPSHLFLKRFGCVLSLRFETKIGTHRKQEIELVGSPFITGHQGP
jgi:hypothetical protein